MSLQPEAVPGRILLIEDNPSDARIIAEAFSEAEIPCELNVLYSGEEVGDFLSRQGRFARAQRPDLILLDLNMPGKDGREVLTEIKSDPELRIIPVLVLTNSNAEQDVLDSYHRHANCYIVKPLSYEHTLDMVREIGEFWFRVARLPSKGGVI